MTTHELMVEFKRILEDNPMGILATVTTDGYPAMRFMSTSLLPGKNDALYAITAGSFPKVKDLETHPQVSWMFTSNKTREVISFRGSILLIDNPRFKSEILEELGKGLETFWRLNDDPSNLVCLETRLASAEYFNPKTAEKFQTTFETDQDHQATLATTI